MKIKDIRNQLLDLDFKMVLKHNEINIINYIELLDFNENIMKIKYSDGILKVEGKNLKLKKILNDELLIFGEIYKVELRWYYK